MRKFLLVTAFLVQLGTFNLFAQAPNQFSYQAVIRDANGKIVEEGGPELADKLEEKGYAEYITA